MVRLHHTFRLARATLLTAAMLSVIALGSSEPAPRDPAYHPFCTVEGTVNETVQKVRWKGSSWLEVRLAVERVEKQERDIPAGATEGTCRLEAGDTARVFLTSTGVEAGDRVRGTAHYEETRLVEGVFIRDVRQVK